MAVLSKQVSDLKIQNQRTETCILCSGNHNTTNCTVTMESVQYVRNQGNFGNYNNVQPQWKGQVNNSWNSQPSVLYQRPAQPPGFQHPQQQSDHNQP